MSVAVPAYLRDVVVDHGSLLTMAATLMRQDVEVSEALLTARASAERCTYPELLEWARETVRSGNPDEGGLPIDHWALASLARWAAGHPGPANDQTESADLHQALRVVRRGQTLHGAVDLLDVQTNLAVGRFEYVQRVLPQVRLDADARWMVDCDLANPFIAPVDRDEQTWLRTANGYLTGFGIAPIRLLDVPADVPYDRLSAEPVAPVAGDQPLVTVVMSAYSPGPSLRTALRSLLDQSWQNLQILLVDDCSPAEYQDVLTEATAMDERIELVRMPENGGTYRIRNHAMTLARGDFVTFQDSDDWSHPERIARQVRVLLDRPEVVATTSRALRLFEDLSVSVIGYRPERTNVSSLLFRRSEVLERLGGWDPVRKGADSEFMERIGVVFGVDAVVKLEEPLALVQLTHGSLSRAEFRISWWHPGRRGYLANFRHWHHRLAAGLESPFLDPEAPRRFPAPPVMAGLPEPTGIRCDVLHAADWRRGIGRHHSAPGQVAAISDELDVRILHTEAPRFARWSSLPLDSDVLELIRTEQVDRSSWGDDLHAGLLILDDAETAGFLPPPELVTVTADRVVVTAAFPPVAPDGTTVYEPMVVEREVERRWGRPPEWLPAAPPIADALRSAGVGGPVHAPRPWAALEPRPRRITGRRDHRRIIVGAVASESPGSRVPWGGWAARFPDDDRFDVRILDRADTLRVGGRVLPPNWLVLTGGSTTAFLDQLDVLVVMPRRTWGPDPDWNALRAMARGCAVVAGPEHEPFFGAAARYADEADVATVVSSLVADRKALTTQQDRGLDFVASVASPASYQSLIQGLLPTSSEKVPV